jgi:hypothetical protein
MRRATARGIGTKQARLAARSNQTSSAKSAETWPFELEGRFDEGSLGALSDLRG